MNCRTESERFCIRQGGRDKIAAGVAEYYVEDDFGSANAAGCKISRLNAKAFCLGLLCIREHTLKPDSDIHP
jgi:hypothetical protein